MYYFAYGSNMSSEIFVERRGIQPLEQYNALLQDYRLVFDHKGIQYLEPCFASLEKQINAQVYGILYRITPNDVERLHNSEGNEYRYTKLKVSSTETGKITCFTYITRHPCRGRKPSRRYMSKLIAGALEHGLPEVYIKELRKVETFHLPVVSHAVDILAKVIIPYLAQGNALKIPFLKIGVKKD